MSNVHPEVGPELRALLTQLMTMIDPVMRAAAALTPAADGEPGKCQQVWCPVCAIAALASGRHHPLTAALAEHGSALLAMVRTFGEASGSGSGSTTPAAPAPDAGDQPPTTTSTYEHISITVYE